MSPGKLLGFAAFCLVIPTQIGTQTTDAGGPLLSRTTLIVGGGDGVAPTTTTTAAAPPKDPKEAARQAALELSKEIFRNITKHLRESLATKDLSQLANTNEIHEEKDDLHPFRHQPKHHHEHHWGPYFDEPEGESGVLAVRVHLASEALLNCRVGMLRDKTVMWLRRTAEKVHLLTVGATTYSGDARVSVKFQYPNNWRLSINPVEKEDAGLYMCQVSTHPPRVLLTNVTVLAPILKIVDEQGHEVRDRYYKAGSSVELSCRVSRAFTSTLASSTTTTGPPPSLKKLLERTSTTTTTTTSSTITGVPGSSDAITVIGGPPSGSFSVEEAPTTPSVTTVVEMTRQTTSTVPPSPPPPQANNNVFGISWQKDGKPLLKVISRNLSSTFKLRHAEQKDSGAYSCSILNTSTVVVHVQVLSGETQAAVHHDTVGRGAPGQDHSWITLCWPIVLLLLRMIKDSRRKI